MAIKSVGEGDQDSGERLEGAEIMAEESYIAGDRGLNGDISTEREAEIGQGADSPEETLRELLGMPIAETAEERKEPSNIEFKIGNSIEEGTYDDTNPGQYVAIFQDKSATFLHELASTGSFSQAASETELPLRAWLWWREHDGEFQQAWDFAVEEGDSRLLEQFLAATLEGQKIFYRPLTTILKMRRPQRYTPIKTVRQEKPKATGAEAELEAYLRMLSWVESVEMDEDAKAKLTEELNKSFGGA